MGLFATGVTVIMTRVNGDIHGMTASSVAPVSLDPLLVWSRLPGTLACTTSFTGPANSRSSFVSEHQEELSRHFAGAGTSLRPASLRFEFGPDDSAPFIHDTLAAIRCRIEREVDVGDHVVVLGRVIQFHAGFACPPADLLRQPLLLGARAGGAGRSRSEPKGAIMNTAFSDPTGRAIPFGLSPPAFRSPDETTKEEVGLAKAVKVVEQRRSGIELAKLLT